MAVAYLMVSVAFASLCSLLWALSGGGLLGAVAAYVMSGQIALIAGIGLRALRGGLRPPAS